MAGTEAAIEAIRNFKAQVITPIATLEEALTRVGSLDQAIFERKKELDLVMKQYDDINASLRESKANLADTNKQISERRAVLAKLLGEAK